MSQTGELDLDSVERIVETVKYAGKTYLLKEATGDVACKYRNASLKCAKMTQDGKFASVEGLADVEPMLVSLCLWQVMPDGTERPVAASEVRSWPNRVQKRLFDRAVEISELKETKEEDEAAKNGQSDTADGSASV